MHACYLKDTERASGGEYMTITLFLTPPKPPEGEPLEELQMLHFAVTYTK